MLTVDKPETVKMERSATKLRWPFSRSSIMVQNKFFIAKPTAASYILLKANKKPVGKRRANQRESPMSPSMITNSSQGADAIIIPLPKKVPGHRRNQLYHAISETSQHWDGLQNLIVALEWTQQRSDEDKIGASTTIKIVVRICCNVQIDKSGSRLAHKLLSGNLDRTGALKAWSAIMKYSNQE